MKFLFGIFIFCLTSVFFTLLLGPIGIAFGLFCGYYAGSN